MNRAFQVLQSAQICTLGKFDPPSQISDVQAVVWDAIEQRSGSESVRRPARRSGLY